MIRGTVSFDTDAWWISAKWALLSTGPGPLANIDSTIVSTSPRRQVRFGTITGSKVPLRSRGTSTMTGRTLSVSTVFVVVPFLELPNW